MHDVILRPGGQVEYLVACGAGTGWNICYSKANELCPGGYTTLSENAGFNRKEMHIACPGQSAKHDPHCPYQLALQTASAAAE